jgi:hypothetical protein
MATGQWHWYAGGLLAILNKEADLDTDALKLQLHTSAYTPDPAHNYQDDLTNEVANGNGYTTGGAALAGVALAVVDDSALTAWATGTAYKVGQVRRPTSANGYVYRCVVAGTSDGTTEPTWPTVVGREVTDGTAVWVCAGVSLVKLDFNDPSWAAATFTARYAVIVDTTPGSSATNPLVGYCDFGEDVSPNNGTLAITIDADGALHAIVG